MAEITSYPRLGRGAAAVLLALIVAAGFSGCSILKTESPARREAPGSQERALTPRAPAKSAPKPAPFVHTVKYPGETLSIIAAWYTGNMANWRAIAQANSDISPTQMNMGDTVTIPAELLKTREPMPQSFVQKMTPKPRKRSEPAAPRREAPAKADTAPAPETKAPEKPAPTRAEPPPVIFGPK